MSSENIPLTPAGRPLTAGAIGLMLMLCLSWGFNQIAVKLALPDIPPFLQAFIRSCGAIVVLLLIAWIRGVKLFARTGSGTVIGGVIVAPRASELIFPLALAVEQRLTVDQVARAFTVYPSLSGSITDAARAMHIVL